MRAVEGGERRRGSLEEARGESSERSENANQDAMRGQMECPFKEHKGGVLKQVWDFEDADKGE